MSIKKIFNKSVVTAAVSSVLLAGCLWDDPRWVADQVSQAVKERRLVRILTDLEVRATPTEDGSSTTRAAGSEGYENSVEYIKRKMRKMGYKVWTQELDFRSWVELANTSLAVNGQTLVHIRDATDDVPADYATMSYSGGSGGPINAPIAFVTPDFDFDAPDYDSSDGCEASDFDGVDVSGKVAVIQRGACTFDAKVSNAEAAGAVAVIVFNQGNSDGRKGVVNGTLGSDTGVTIPAFGARFDLGKDWYDALQGGASYMADLAVAVRDENIVTHNVLAETRKGNDDQVVMLGAHLDSVPEGPGINDNGSGTAGLLEYATALKKMKVKPKNKIRFAWWAAEEAGLVGSNFYTNALFSPIRDDAVQLILDELGLDDPSQLTEEQLEMVDARYNELNPVKLYLNFDMIGSPNYIYGVMDGDLSDTKDSPDNAYPGDFEPPYGTSDIESLFNEYFDNANEKTVPQALSNRSDYAGFAQWGVAFGGLFTGAERVKSDQEAADFGGEAGVAYDKCYHQACDDFGNVSHEALVTNTKSLSYVTTYYAMSEQLFPPKPEAEVQPFGLRSLASPTHTHHVGDVIKAASREHADHGHFHGDFDQDRE